MSEHDPMFDSIPRYTMLVKVDYMGAGTGIAAEPNPDGGWINAADLPALIARVREDEQTRLYSNKEIQAVIRLASSKAYAAALRDAKAAVMAVSGGGGGLKLKVHEHYRNCIAAIEVLGGAR